jgi:hypothetical protein
MRFRTKGLSRRPTGKQPVQSVMNCLAGICGSVFGSVRGITCDGYAVCGAAIDDDARSAEPKIVLFGSGHSRNQEQNAAAVGNRDRSGPI